MLTLKKDTQLQEMMRLHCHKGTEVYWTLKAAGRVTKQTWHSSLRLVMTPDEMFS